MQAQKPDEQAASLPSSSKTIRLAYGPEAPQFGELYLPQQPGPHPTVILIHGGYWRARYGLDLMTGLAEDLAARGIAAWNIEYRRVGDPGGGWPGTFADVALAADYLRILALRYALDLKRVAAIGHSAGGHLAFWLAARPRIAKSSSLEGTQFTPPVNSDDETSTPLALVGAISLAGVVDLEMAYRLNLSNGAVVDLLGGSLDEVPQRYAAASPATMLPLGVPQVLIHGTKDDSVPLEVSQAYTQAARAANDQVNLIVLKGVDHFALIDPHSAAWTTAIEALEEILAVR